MSEIINTKEIRVGLKIRPTITSNRIFLITKVTNKYVWIKRIPSLPSEGDFKYKKGEIIGMDIIGSIENSTPDFMKV